MPESPSTDELLDATTAMLPPLLRALEALGYAGRHLHPPDLPALVAGLRGLAEPLAAGLRAFEAIDWPDHLTLFQTRSRMAAAEALGALEGLAACLETRNPVLSAYRAMGGATRAVEALYPVAFMLPPVNRFFLCEPERDDPALQQALLASDPYAAGVGVMHAGNTAGDRGGFSLYVPEYHAPQTPAPLVVALHGGSGHGRSFLWTWLKEARSRGAIVLAPTSRQDTWSLMDPAVDAVHLRELVEHVKSEWAIDESRILLTGMSDGGTFAYLAGLEDDAPYTHLAPVSATFHPLLLEIAGAERLRGLPVYLVHGALDWMFPVDVARLAREALTAAGADVTFREIADLSHTYPREENVRILDWLNSTVGAASGRE
ncbi:MAG TPA: dienelactone hydrolase family protein [Pseudomonadales bacterium]